MPKNHVGPDGLTPRQREAAILISTGAKTQAVADKLGMAKSTIINYLAIPAFQAAVQSIQEAAWLEASSIQPRVLPEAVQTLIEVSKDQEARPADRVAAARTLIQHSTSMIQLNQIRSRLLRMENFLHEQQQVDGDWRNNAADLPDLQQIHEAVDSIDGGLRRLDQATQEGEDL